MTRDQYLGEEIIKFKKACSSSQQQKVSISYVAEIAGEEGGTR